MYQWVYINISVYRFRGKRLIVEGNSVQMCWTHTTWYTGLRTHIYCNTPYVSDIKTWPKAKTCFLSLLLYIFETKRIIQITVSRLLVSNVWHLYLICSVAFSCSWICSISYDNLFNVFVKRWVLGVCVCTKKFKNWCEFELFWDMVFAKMYFGRYVSCQVWYMLLVFLSQSRL